MGEGGIVVGGRHGLLQLLGSGGRGGRLAVCSRELLQLSVCRAADRQEARRSVVQRCGLSPGLLLVLAALDPAVARHVVGVGGALVGARLVRRTPHVGGQGVGGRAGAALHVSRERRVGGERVVVPQPGEQARVTGRWRQERRGKVGHVFSSIAQEARAEHGLAGGVLAGRELLESLHIVLVR